MMGSNQQAEDLMAVFNEGMGQLPELRAKLEQMIHEHALRIIEIRKQAQEVCTHPSTRIEFDEDRHNNISWDTHYCTVCDKWLYRE